MAKQKASILGIVMGLVVLAMCAISIVGLAVDEWTAVKAESDLIDLEEFDLDSYATSFGDYSETVIGEDGENLEDIEISFDRDNPAAMRTAMVVFGYIAVIAVCALAVLYLLKMVLNFGLMRFFVGILGIVTLAAGAVLTGMTVAYCNSMTVAYCNSVISIDIPLLGSAECVLGIGAYLTCIGTMAGGLAAVIGVARK